MYFDLPRERNTDARRHVSPPHVSSTYTHATMQLVTYRQRERQVEEEKEKGGKISSHLEKERTVFPKQSECLWRTSRFNFLESSLPGQTGLSLYLSLYVVRFLCR